MSLYLVLITDVLREVNPDDASLGTPIPIQNQVDGRIVGITYNCTNRTMYGLRSEQTKTYLYSINTNTNFWNLIDEYDSDGNLFDITYSEKHKRFFSNSTITGTVVLNPTSKSWEPIGPTLLDDNSFRGIAYDCKNDIMYGTSRDITASVDTFYLSTINLKTGQWTRKPNPIAIGINDISKLTYDQDSGILYGIGTGQLAQRLLINIDINTGVGTVIGTMYAGLVVPVGLASVYSNCCKYEKKQCCKEEIIVPPLSESARPYLSPVAECSRYKSTTGAGLGLLTSPIPNCLDRRLTHDEKDRLVGYGYWNYYSELKPNSPLSNRLKRLQNKSAQRRR